MIHVQRLHIVLPLSVSLLSGCIAADGPGAAGSGTSTSTLTSTGTGTSASTSTSPTVFTQLVQAYRPAVVVRDISCLACHAIIQGSVVTDFGSPDTWFLNGFQNPTSAGTAHYTAIDWQLLQSLTGQVVIPDVTVPNSFVQAQLASGTLPNGGTTSLESYLTRTDLADFWGPFWFNYFDMQIPATKSFTNNVRPVAAQASVMTHSSIYIAAPTAAQILAVVPAPQASGPWVQVKGAASAGLSGLTVEAGQNGQSYVMTTGPVNCSGQDVVINGTLLIENGQFFAENGGCRLYATGSVFVEGPINYLSSGASPDPTQNVQITSASAIFMGIGLNGWASNGDGSVDCSGSNPLQVRLFCDARQNYYFRNASTPAAYAAYANGIYAEATNIGLPLLQDASVPGVAPSALSAARQRRGAIDFEHLLLNAPMIQSRYLGTLVGMVVGESATFSLGEFSVIYDPVFGAVPIFPGFPVPSLCFDGNCNCTDTGTATATATQTATSTDTSTTSATATSTATLTIAGFDLTTTDDTGDVIWQTPGDAATGQVYWGTSPTELDDSMSEGAGYVTVHSASVPGLESGTLYYFQVSSTDAGGNTVYSSVISKVTK